MIGAGLAGISAAITLAQAGCDVTIYEQNAHIGGKLNTLTREGYVFDLGPSILTLPHLFDPLFGERTLADYVPLRRLHPHWRCFFEDGERVDLDDDPVPLRRLLQNSLAPQSRRGVPPRFARRGASPTMFRIRFSWVLQEPLRTLVCRRRYV